MMVLDYLLFSPKGEFRWKHPFVWILTPMAYMVFILVRVEVSGAIFAGFSGMSRYPYPFVDVDLYGIYLVLTMVSVLLLIFLILGFLLFAIDKLLGKCCRK